MKIINYCYLDRKVYRKPNWYQRNREQIWTGLCAGMLFSVIMFGIVLF